jgi:hypothetical protein
MQSCELIDLAAFVAAQGPLLIASRRQVPDAALAQYWTASKCRLDRWNRTLRTAGAVDGQNRTSSVANRHLAAVCEEILISEMLTRIWSCVLTALDYSAGSGEAQPIAASVMAGHLEASNRVLSLISYKPHTAHGADSELNRLRRLTERWTDLLLGSLGTQVHGANFAHDPTRLEEFSRDLSGRQEPEVRRKIWDLIISSLRTSLAAHIRGPAPNHDLNSRLAGAILACFPVNVFDATSIYHSLWNLRLSAITADAQQLVDQLLAADSSRAVAVDR